MPFFIMTVGYAMMLCIDKVLFDAHAILDDDHHGHGHAAPTVEVIDQVRVSIVKSVRDHTGSII